MKVLGIHAKNAEIDMENEDYLKADKEIENGMKYLDDREKEEVSEDDLLKEGKIVRDRGEIKFKKGEICNAESDFDESEQIFQKILTKSRDKLIKLKSEFVKKKIKAFFTCGCSQFEQINEENEKAELKIREEEEKIEKLKKEVDGELMKVLNSIKEVAIYVEDKSKYENCVTKAKGYLAELQGSKTNDPYEKAKLKMVEATVKTYLNLAESENLINDAIQMIENQNPMHEDVGKYSQAIAKIQKNYLDKLTNPKSNLQYNDEEEKKVESYKEESKKLKETYEKCQKNYERALNILLYNQKSKNSKEVLNLQNQLIELQYNTENFQSCEDIIMQIREEQKNLSQPRSEHAQASLVLAKIYYCRGSLKYAFEILEEVKLVLKEALVKDKNNS